jgi:ribosomal protein L29
MSEYTKKTESELLKILTEKREALRVFRFGGSGGKQKDVKAGATARKEIARILTTLKEKAVKTR